MPGWFKLDDRVTCVRNNNAMGQRHAGKISKVRRTVRIIDGVAVPIPHRSTRPAHASMLRAGHRGHAGPQLEPQQRLRRVPLLLSRRGDVRRLEAQRHVVLLHKVRRRRGGAQGGPGADLPEQIMLVTSTATRSPAASTPAIGDSSDTTDTLLFSPPSVSPLACLAAAPRGGCPQCTVPDTPPPRADPGTNLQRVRYIDLGRGEGGRGAP